MNKPIRCPRCEPEITNIGFCGIFPYEVQCCENHQPTKEELKASEMELFKQKRMKKELRRNKRSIQ